MSSFADLSYAARRAPPQLAVVLGSGLSVVARRLQQADSVSYKDVPGLTTTTVAGHKGCLTLGIWAGRRVVVFEGRLHYYEGHPWAAVTLPVQIAHQLGARILLLTNAAGGIHAALGPGSFMVVRDHIEWSRPHAWRQPGPGALGPARSSPYSPRLIALLQQAARGVGLDLLAGVYAQVTGPSYEARAEIRALKTWGADAVGMSTAREVQTASELGMECAALSCITNRAAGLGAGPLHHDEVLAAAKEAGERAGDLIEAFLRLL